MRDKKLGWFFVFLVFAAASGVAQIKQEKNVINPGEITRAVQELSAQGDSALVEIDALYRKADALTESRRFAEAAEVYKQIRAAYQKMGQSPFIARRVEALDSKEKAFYLAWSRAMEAQADAAYLNGNWEKTIEIASASTGQLKNQEPKYPGVEAESAKENKLVEMAKKEIKSDKFKEESSLLAADPENARNKEKIEMYMKQANVFLRNQRYLDARDVLERVLVLDPYNYTAMQMLRGLYRNLFGIARMRRSVETLDRLTEVEWAWNEPVPPSQGEKVTPVVDIAKAKASDMLAKLENIVIDKVNFENADISAVITLLQKESMRFDPEGTGIYIVLRLDRNTQGALPKITMQLDDIPVGEVIKYICQATGLQYRVEERIVLIGDDTINVMRTRSFPVRSALISSIAPMAMGGEETKMGEGTTGTASGAEIFDPTQTLAKKESTEKKKQSISSEQLQKYFQDRGINFPAFGEPNGSHIAYDRNSSQLIVTNTPENLRRMDSMLRQLDIVQPLVLIETKFVEIDQNDLEELGFDWFFTKSANNSDTNIWAINDMDGYGKPSNMATANDSILRHSTGGSGSGSPQNAIGKLINDLKIDVDPDENNRMDLRFYMFALDRSGMANVLSAPKVIATSGSSALIRMVREEYFPESWNEPETSIVGNNGLQYTPSYPEFGDATDIGIRLEVTPTVSSNKYTIALELHPEVIDMTGWSDYSYNVLLGKLGDTMATLKMPEISRREVTTNVKIYDGETVILGGMLKEKSQGTDDRVPGLGDVPIAGRLFRSKFGNTQKVNLMIFVTARLVNPDGLPVRRDLPNGIFDFKR